MIIEKPTYMPTHGFANIGIMLRVRFYFAKRNNGRGFVKKRGFIKSRVFNDAYIYGAWRT